MVGGGGDDDDDYDSDDDISEGRPRGWQISLPS